MLALASRVAGSLGVPVHAVLVGGDAVDAANALGAHGVSVAHVVEHPQLDAYAPVAWAASLGEVVASIGAVGVIAPGSERGTEVLAHLAARNGLQMAANVIDVPETADTDGGGGRWRIVRQRWAGSLLEEAWLGGSTPALTVAAHAVAPAEAAAAAATPEIRHVTPTLTDADLRV